MPATLDIALAQFRPRKGDYRANLARLGGIFAQLEALDPRPQLLHLPETALSGYFVEGGVRDLAVSAGTLARDLDATYRASLDGAAPTRPLDVAVGFYEVWNSTLYNSAMYVTLGAGAPVVRHVHRKNFLPTYGLFDEERFVERGLEVRAFDTTWGRMAMLVCEDAWHSLTGTVAALDGAELVLVSSAAPARGVWPRTDGVPGPASSARWERLIRDIAEEHGVFVSFTNLVGSEGGKSFAGGSMVSGPRGDIAARVPQLHLDLVPALLLFFLQRVGEHVARAHLVERSREQIRHVVVGARTECTAAGGLGELVEDLVRPESHDVQDAAGALGRLHQRFEGHPARGVAPVAEQENERANPLIRFRREGQTQRVEQRGRPATR
jgi:predicted amidohydrolase